MDEREIDNIIFYPAGISRPSDDFFDAYSASGVLLDERMLATVGRACDEVAVRLSNLLDRQNEGIVGRHIALLSLSLVLSRLGIEFGLSGIDRIGRFRFSRGLYNGLYAIASNSGLNLRARSSEPSWWVGPVSNMLSLGRSLGISSVNVDMEATKRSLERIEMEDRGRSPRALALAYACLHAENELPSAMLDISRTFSISLRRLAETIGCLDDRAITRLGCQSKRRMLVEDSVRRNRKTDVELCFYSPSETLAGLVENKKIADWFERLDKFEYERPREGILLLFPCAASKPWARARTHSASYRMLYSILDDLKADKHTSIATVSEPLAIVPEEMYDEMPIYDCPGLFKAFASSWKLEWNEDDYRSCIELLGCRIAHFLERHAEKFEGVHALVQEGSPHHDMLTFAKGALGLDVRQNVEIHAIRGRLRENAHKVRSVLTRIL